MLNPAEKCSKTAHKPLSLTITLAVLFLLCRSTIADVFSVGPLFDQFPLTIGSGQRVEILGPLYYKEHNDDAVETWALPPLFSRQSDPTIDEFEDSSFYPVFTYVKYGTQYRAQFFQLFNIAGGEDPGDLTKSRFNLFPLYFQQRCADPEYNYTAFFPFYGHLQNTLFHDRIYFVMFPAYSETQKKDVINDNYFYPFVNVRHGNGMQGWQFWPFYGSEHKVLTTTTNQWGTIETNGGHDQYFILWPFHIRQSNGIGTDNPQKLRSNIPFYASLRSPQRDWTSVLWPFFNWIDDRGNQYWEKELPWPVIEFARGRGKTANRVFPFFSRSHNASLEDDFYAWPIYKFDAIHAPPLERHRTRIAFFLYQNTLEKSTETGKFKRRVDLWPLLLYRRDFDGNTRLQALALLETFMPASPQIERNWSPLWSLWRSENNPSAGADSQSLLWNFYRRDASAGAKKISFFFGLYQYQSNPEGKKLRLFYLPVFRSQGHENQHAGRP